jgi:acyl-coenzyme A thioesterase PaaI-like protein
MSKHESVSPPALTLSQSMARTVASLRRTLKALYHVHPEHDSESIASLAEQLETEISAAGTMGLGQPSESRHTRSPLAGSMNPVAPPVAYEYGENSIRGEVRFHEGYQGPPACVHGGFVAALLDDGLGRTRHLTGRNCVTGSLNITYKRPTPINADLVIEARIEEIFERKFRVTGEILHEGLITASAEAIFVFRDTEKFNALVSEARDASR